MRFSLLGPLVVADGAGNRTALAGPRLRVMLAALLLHANVPVPAGELAEMVWDGSPPAGAVVTLRSYAARLRRALGEDSAPIVARDPGYQIHAGPQELDVLQFEALCADARAALRAGQWADASAAAERALGLWRAAPLLDVPCEALRGKFVPRLERLRLQALEDVFDAGLRLGHYQELAPQLLEVTTRYPLQERFHAQLMLALAAAGRRAQALDAYQQARRILIDELGIEPGPELRAVHQQILAADAETASTAGAAPAREGPGTVRAPGGLEVLAGVLDQAHAEIRDRVLRAAAGLDIAHPGAAPPRTPGIREIAGVVYRRVPGAPASDSGSAEDTENLQFMHVFGQGVEAAAAQSGFSVLTSAVDANDKNAARQLLTLALKCDGLIMVGLGFMEPSELDLLGSQVPLVTLGGPAMPHGASVRGDDTAGMRDLARHLIHEHGYQTLGYLGGDAFCPDNADRRNAVAAVAGAAGIELFDGPDWQGSYYLHGGAQVIEKLIRERKTLPRAIVCAHDLSAIGAIRALARHGIAVPRDVAVTGFDDLPVARRLTPSLTTVRTPIWALGTTAFGLLHTAITNRHPQQHNVVLPDRLIRRESCGCLPGQPNSRV